MSKEKIKMQDVKKMPKIVLLSKQGGVGAVPILGVCHVLEGFGFDVRAVGPLELLPDFFKELQTKIKISAIFIWKEDYTVEEVKDIVKDPILIVNCGFFHEEDFEKAGEKNLFTIAGFEGFVNHYPSLYIMGNHPSVITGKRFNYGSVYLLPDD